MTWRGILQNLHQERSKRQTGILSRGSRGHYRSPSDFHATQAPVALHKTLTHLVRRVTICISRRLKAAARDRWMALTSEHTPISAAKFTHNRLALSGPHGEGLLLLLVAYVLWISLVAKQSLCNPCILHSSGSYRLLPASVLQSPLSRAWSAHSVPYEAGKMEKNWTWHITQLAFFPIKKEWFTAHSPRNFLSVISFFFPVENTALK